MTNNPTPIEIDVHSVKQLLDDQADMLLIDCREPSEYETARIDQATLIPMAEIQYRLEEIEPYREKQIVIHCHHGGRSLRVTNYLRQSGFAHATNMAGGIDQWSREIDPSIPRYK
jgi:rhodanese-related sulfurtransferase